MKRLFVFIILLTGIALQAQTPNSFYYDWLRGAEFSDTVKLSYLTAPANDTLVLVQYPNSEAIDTISIKNLNQGADFSAFVGREITRDFTTVQGDTFEGIKNFLFPPQPPTASMTVTFRGSTSGGNFTVEKSSSGTDTAIVNWTAVRQGATPEIDSIQVEGVNQSFTQPALGGTATGDDTLTFAKNTNKTINLVVYANDLSDSDALTIRYRYSRYWGASASTPATQSDLLSGNSELVESKSKTFTLSPSNEHIYFAYPTSLGTLSSIKVNGFETIGAFTQTTASITNASGATENYYIYTSNNALSGSQEVITQ